jgi:hypothetical protein
MMFKYLLVGGHFGNKPKKSGYISKLSSVLKGINPNGLTMNGGKYEELYSYLKERSTFPEIGPHYDVIFWMPDISNDKEKLVGYIKKIYPKTILVTSKNNAYGKYQFMELVARALQVKANLFVEFFREGSSKIFAAVHDPLGNCYCSTPDITLVGVTLMNRIQELLRFTRIGSEAFKWGDLKGTLPNVKPEVDSRFFDLVKDYADVFHECIHGANTSRLLGNASFRCERGFPSYKDNDQIYVSRRNIDKRHIDPDGFVPVKLIVSDKYKWSLVAYAGEHKPSVDAPIQLLLYNYYHNVRYMLHSHTYIRHAPFTSHRIPCGAIEEFYEIIKICPDREHNFLMLNLIGHGSIVITRDIRNLMDLKYYPRSTPEEV